MPISATSSTSTKRKRTHMPLSTSKADSTSIANQARGQGYQISAARAYTSGEEADAELSSATGYHDNDEDMAITETPSAALFNEELLPSKRARKGSNADQLSGKSTRSSSASFKTGNHPTANQEVDLNKLTPAGYHINPPPVGRPVRVYADGVFDLFHLGHMRQLEQAKKAFPDTYLIVGIPSDYETHKRKGLTVLTDKERAETLRHCKWVDEVIEDAPWILDLDFLENQKIDYVAHDDEPYAGTDTDDIYRSIKEAGKFMVTQRTEGISTTYIITKIIRDYEKYIYRQLKRGTSRQELNVSWLKKNELELKRHVTELRDTIKNNWSTTGRELKEEFRNYWSPHTRPSSASDGNLNKAYNEIENGEAISRPQSPHTDFAAGYSLGLVNGIRTWMMRKSTMTPSEASSDDEQEGGLELPKRSRYYMSSPLVKTDLDDEGAEEDSQTIAGNSKE